MFTADHVAFANSLRKGTLSETLGMEFAVDDAGNLRASMPVDERSFQPMRLLHGGATAALAETLGSMGSAVLIERSKQGVVGIELGANHLRGVKSGSVTASGKLIHKGRTTHVWDISVTNDSGELVAVCRITNLIIDQRP